MNPSPFFKTFFISVIIPAYNQGKFIAEAIESVWHQDYPQGQIEIIVIDDGSTDDTRNVVEKCHLSGIGCNLKYIYQANQGKAMAMKAGIEAAQGKYIFNLDADDVFLPGKIRKTIEIFENDREVAYVSHPVIYWDAQKNTKTLEKFPRFLRGKVHGKELLRYFYGINKFYGCGSSFAGRAEALKQIPINRKDIGYSIDAYLVLFCANAGWAYFMDEPLSLYRVHDGAYSAKERVKRAKIDMEANKAISEEIFKDGSFDNKIKILQLLKFKSSELKFKIRQIREWLSP